MSLGHFRKCKKCGSKYGVSLVTLLCSRCRFELQHPKPKIGEKPDKQHAKMGCEICKEKGYLEDMWCNYYDGWCRDYQGDDLDIEDDKK